MYRPPAIFMLDPPPPRGGSRRVRSLVDLSLPPSLIDDVLLGFVLSGHTGNGGIIQFRGVRFVSDLARVIIIAASTYLLRPVLLAAAFLAAARVESIPQKTASRSVQQCTVAVVCSIFLLSSC